MRRKLGLLLVALLLAAAIGDTLIWYFAVQRMRTGLAAWAAVQRENGWTVKLGSMQSGGWPIAARLAVQDVTLRGGASEMPGGLSWQAGQVTLQLDLRHPKQLQIDVAGPQQLGFGTAPGVTYTAQRLQLRVPLQAAAAVQPFHLHGEALRVGGAADVTTLDRLDVDGAVALAAQPGEPALSLALNAGGITLPARVKSPLGPQIASVVLDAALNDLFPAAPSPAASAAEWHALGGRVTVQRLATQWGPLGLNATAMLALDPQLQPTGSAAAQVTGYGATLDALATAGVMSRGAAITATAVLSLLSQPPAKGQPPQVDVPLSLQNRTLAMHGIPLLRLPELDWPQH